MHSGRGKLHCFGINYRCTIWNEPYWMFYWYVYCDCSFILDQWKKVHLLNLQRKIVKHFAENHIRSFYNHSKELRFLSVDYCTPVSQVLLLLSRSNMLTLSFLTNITNLFWESNVKKPSPFFSPLPFVFHSHQQNSVNLLYFIQCLFLNTFVLSVTYVIFLLVCQGQNSPLNKIIISDLWLLYSHGDTSFFKRIIL